MIHYNLVCKAPGCEHAFDSWFKDSAGFSRLEAAGLLECPVCGSSEVNKALMAPAVAKPQQERPRPVPSGENGTLAALRAFRRRIEASGQDVGREFAAQARQMHNGEVPHRNIYGTATPQEARALADEGVPVATVPWVHLDDA